MTGRHWKYGGLAIAALACAAPAMAWVQICNGSPQKLSAAVAIAPMDPAGVSTGGHQGAAVEGWWSLSPGECAQVSDAVANSNWMYFHAHGNDMRLEGSARLCVRTKAFNSRQQFLMGNAGCGQGWQEAGFVRRTSSAKNYKFTINPAR